MSGRRERRGMAADMGEAVFVNVKGGVIPCHVAFLPQVSILGRSGNTAAVSVCQHQHQRAAVPCGEWYEHIDL